MRVMADGLAPGFLIASPPLGDPNFDRTVVLLAVHGDQGALGFVVNRIAPVKLGELLSFAGYGDDSAGDESPVFIGGPVQPSSGWIVCDDASLKSSDDGVIEVGDRVRVTSSKEAFDRLARQAAKQPGLPSDVGGSGRTITADGARLLVVLGYSGWGPGQLEGEIAAGAWLPVPLDEDVLFDVDVTERWERAYRLVGLTPVEMMSMRSVGEA
jgi:putative transcriptional regulator